MRTRDLIDEALSALNANRLRSALTMLGVVIGVGSVVMILAIGEGSRRGVADSISSLGANQLIVLSGSPNSGGLRGAAGGLPTLKLSDAEAMADLFSVAAVAPVSSSSAQVIFGARNKSTNLTGTTPSYFNVSNLELAAGESFHEAQVRTAANVVVIGETVRQALFEGAEALGQTVRIQRQTFTVVGVLRKKGQGFGGQDQDDVVLLPITTAQRKLSGTPFAGSVSMVVVASRFPDQKGHTEEEVTSLLRQLHHIAPGMEDDFSVRDLSALSETLAATTRILSILLAAIASISLAVGGIGIMNIMLVSVTERTREIGLRMALGGNRQSIRRQFMLESILLSLAGALGGLALGIGAGFLLRQLGMSVVFQMWSVVLSLSVAVGVGILFGWWPARQASLLEPVEALRYQ